MKHRGKRIKRNEDNLRDLGDNVKCPNIRIIGVPEEIKKSQYIMNNAINEIKNTLEGTNSRITEAEDRVNKVEDRMV